MATLRNLSTYRKYADCKSVELLLVKLWLLLPCRTAALVKADSIRRRSRVWQTVHRSWWGHEAFVPVRTGKSNANSNYPSHGTLPSQLAGPNALIMVKNVNHSQNGTFLVCTFHRLQLATTCKQFWSCEPFKQTVGLAQGTASSWCSICLTTCSKANVLYPRKVLCSCSSRSNNNRYSSAGIVTRLWTERPENLAPFLFPGTRLFFSKFSKSCCVIHPADYRLRTEVKRLDHEGSWPSR